MMGPDLVSNQESESADRQGPGCKIAVVDSKGLETAVGIHSFEN